MDKNTNRLLATGFFLLIAMMTLVQIGAVKIVESIADSTQKLYQHPFAVSNAVQEVDKDIIAIHRHMKDVALAQNTEELELAIARVDQYEAKVYIQFDLIMTRFLGDKARINKVRLLFSNWKPIRSEVIEFMRVGKKVKAALITKGKGALYVERLTKEMNGLLQFSQNKADEFVNQSIEQQYKSKMILYGLMSVIILISFIISFLVIRRVNKSSIKLRESEERWQFALEDNRDGVWDWNIETNEVFFSNRFKEMLGYKAD